MSSSWKKSLKTKKSWIRVGRVSSSTKCSRRSSALAGRGTSCDYAARISMRARKLFTEVVDESLERLPDTEAGLERTRLLGSPAAAGLAKLCFGWKPNAPFRWWPACSNTASKANSPSRRQRVRGRRDQRQGRPDRSARRRHVPADRLQARLAAEPGPRTAVADLRFMRRTELDGHLGRSGGSAKRPTSRSKARGVSSAVFVAGRASQGPRRGSAAAGRHASTRSPPAIFRRRPTMCSAVRRAPYAAVCRKDYVGDV